VDLSISESKSDNAVIIFSRLDEVDFVVDMGEEEDPNGYWNAVNEPNGHM
jgi:hypothetical protein